MKQREHMELGGAEHERENFRVSTSILGCVLPPVEVLGIRSEKNKNCKE